MGEEIRYLEAMDDRVQKLNEARLREDGRYVVYWSQMNRRVRMNHALEYAIRLANSLDQPVLFYEGLTCTYTQANDRLHTFMLQNVPDTARRLKDRHIGYLFYLRRRTEDDNDVLYRLARSAAAVVTDDYPTFIAAGHNARDHRVVKTYEQALAFMIHVHDRYALDGRDPNTYTNILWCFGLHDRPWGTRPIFGSIRYMSYEGMKRKTDIDAYIEEIGVLEKNG